jgi:hypothetical protein
MVIACKGHVGVAFESAARVFGRQRCEARRARGRAAQASQQQVKSRRLETKA